MRHDYEKINNIPFKVRHRWLNKRLSELEKSGKIDIGGQTIKRFEKRSLPHNDTIFKCEAVLPGTAETFFYGPEGSYLWPAMKGEDNNGIAIERFLHRSGLDAKDMYNLDIEFFIQLIEIYPRLRIPCLAAFISLIPLQHSECRSNKFSPVIFLHLLIFGILTNNKLVLPFNLDEFDELSANEMLFMLKLRPEINKAMRLLMCHEVADALAFYGIHNQALAASSGKLRYPPPIDNYMIKKYKTKATNPDAKQIMLFKADPFEIYNKLATIKVPNRIKNQPIDPNAPDIPVGVLARSHWLKFGNLNKL
jgi:hypothetical protein